MNTYIGLGCFIRTVYQFISQSMGQPDNRKAARDPWNKPIAGAMSAFWKLQLLKSDSITWLVLLYRSVYPFGLWICCGSITQ